MRTELLSLVWTDASLQKSVARIVGTRGGGK